MPEIDISINGILKLLNNLKPGKAAGPDSIRPILLKELKVELAPIIKVIFERSLQTGKRPADGAKLMLDQFLRKVISHWQQITALSPWRAFWNIS